MAPKETKSPLQIQLELDLAHVDAKLSVYEAVAARANGEVPQPPTEEQLRVSQEEKERWLQEQAAMTSKIMDMYGSNS